MSKPVKPIGQVNYSAEHPLTRIVNNLRNDLLDNGFVFGCMFLGEVHDSGVNFGLFFPDKLPASVRKSLLDDLQIALNEARKL